MKLVTVVITLSLLSLVFADKRSTASEDSDVPRSTSIHPMSSADDFDWREIVPYLLVSAGLPEEQGIKALFENSSVLRAYVAQQAADCVPGKNSCALKRDRSGLDEEVSKQIDEIVQEGLFHRHKTAIVDYTLSRQPFPFSEVAAIRSEKREEAYFLLALADRSYTAAQVQAKYGAPYDTDIVQWYSVYKYRLDNPNYTSKAVFEIDPVDGAVLKIAVSLKMKKHKSTH
jgi:hypothetical protein